MSRSPLGAGSRTASKKELKKVSVQATNGAFNRLHGIQQRSSLPRAGVNVSKGPKANGVHGKNDSGNLNNIVNNASFISSGSQQNMISSGEGSVHSGSDYASEDDGSSERSDAIRGGEGEVSEAGVSRSVFPFCSVVISVLFQASIIRQPIFFL